MDKEVTLTRFSESRKALLEAISGLSESEIAGQLVEGIWTTKDLLGHIAAWEQTLVEPLRLFTAGGSFEPKVVGDEEAWNLDQAARRTSWSIAKIHKEIEVTRQELLNELYKLTDKQWEYSVLAPWGDSNTIIEMISGLAWHEEEHTKSIRKAFTR